ncbi:MAG TPA: protein-methionine-sulfoxide reductase heme-binding subunit MsrQ [Pyrinomonadaceae bacterium]|nr:protein-methionine-sulfoxide reductase heme-binding subunit MsrQ [Pyrinomonadaceae bacterium]
MSALLMKDIKFTKLLVFVNCLVPLALLVWDWLRGALGANPLEFVTRTTGTLTLIFLLLTLAVTPARKLTGAQWLVRLRRTLGLYAFFYGLLHLATYVWFDKAFDFAAVVADVTRRPFIAVGMLAFFLMVPLAVTSTNAMIKRLGGKRWALLHRLVYVSAIGGVVHFYLLVKADTRKPLIYGGILALLLGYRLLASYRQKKPLSLGIEAR